MPVHPAGTVDRCRRHLYFGVMPVHPAGTVDRRRMHPYIVERIKKVLRDSSMQGRVREGGDHLAAIMRECKGDTTSGANNSPVRRNSRCGIEFAFSKFYDPFPLTSDRFSLFPYRESALSIVFRSFATVDIHSCNAPPIVKKVGRILLTPSNSSCHKLLGSTCSKRGCLSCG